LVGLHAGTQAAQPLAGLQAGTQAAQPLAGLQARILAESQARSRAAANTDAPQESRRDEGGASDDADAGMQIDISGLDIKKGLDAFAGKTAQYISALLTYAAETPLILEKLRAVNEENLQEYAAGMRELRNASAGIGAESIKRRSYELEIMAKAGDAQRVQKLNGAFVSDAYALIGDINEKYMKRAQ
jgi:hypothetical protein